ncbi:MOSC domain-containing protein [Marininema halotolerans]|uniref:MOSC domain-containing protein YiiM n=1 Tax=Marininema halotolerans TaxID=1155944 RepID=A0A1I6Q255_9BACL|nr:MOSC domain-containing protein [Marininema halotolerans]SFS46589.1 MOSC domain-containing protein YiiM [Marininema halotolerans]
MNAPFITSIQVGKPQTHYTWKRPWKSGIKKERISGPVYLGNTNLAGDGQEDLKNHGGTDKAVLAYGLAHYSLWDKELSGMDLGPGGFGENFTIHGQTERDVCIGDVFRMGEGVLQVSQTRMPCWKLDARWEIEGLSTRVKETGRSGWYLRVLKEGFVEEGQPLLLLDRPHEDWSIEGVNRLIHDKSSPLEEVASLLACDSLAASIKRMLTKRMESQG